MTKHSGTITAALAALAALALTACTPSARVTYLEDVSAPDLTKTLLPIADIQLHCGSAPAAMRLSADGARLRVTCDSTSEPALFIEPQPPLTAEYADAVFDVATGQLLASADSAPAVGIDRELRLDSAFNGLPVTIMRIDATASTPLGWALVGAGDPGASAILHRETSVLYAWTPFAGGAKIAVLDSPRIMQRGYLVPDGGNRFLVLDTATGQTLSERRLPDQPGFWFETIYLGAMQTTRDEPNAAFLSYIMKLEEPAPATTLPQKLIKEAMRFVVATTSTEKLRLGLFDPRANIVVNDVNMDWSLNRTFAQTCANGCPSSLYNWSIRPIPAGGWFIGIGQCFCMNGATALRLDSTGKLTDIYYSDLKRHRASDKLFYLGSATGGAHAALFAVSRRDYGPQRREGAKPGFEFYQRDDGVVVLFSNETGKPIGTFPGIFAALPSDARRIAIASETGVRVYEIPELLK